MRKNIHDSAYKYLFKNKKIFFQLLQSFVNEDFIKEIKIENIELVDKSFISDEFLQREADLIYQIKFKDREIYIYILLEFQSKVDKTIPIRLLVYISQLYDLLYKNSQKGRLPNIFPIVLYNGVDNWTIPTNIKDLIDSNIPERYIPKMEYYLIVEKDIPYEVLERLHNLVAAVVYLEKQKAEEKVLKGAIDKVIEFIKEEELIDVKMFTRWVINMFREKITEEEIEKIKNVEEVRIMLTSLAEKFEKRGFEEGELKGRIEGLREGELKGKWKSNYCNSEKITWDYL